VVDAMSIGLTFRNPPSPNPESTMWVLHKGARTVETRIRIAAGGPELRCYLDGQLLWSQIVRDPGAVGQIATERRLDFQAKGWRAGSQV
jgi:hypothetical protein